MEIYLKNYVMDRNSNRVVKKQKRPVNLTGLFERMYPLKN
jgi:hypothetical protein